jgi:hypothetical protein
MLKTVFSITNAIGALNYKGTWNANTNTPALASGVGTKGDYYVVSVAGTTSIDGQNLWGVGDWIAFNGTAWQRVDGGMTGNFTDLSMNGTGTFNGSGLNASQAAALNSSNQLVTYPYWPMRTVAVAGSNININFNSNVGSSWFVQKSDANNATIEQVSNLPGNGFLLTMIFDVSAGGTLTLLQGAGSFFRLKNGVDAVVTSGNSMTFFARANILFEISRNF